MALAVSSKAEPGWCAVGCTKPSAISRSRSRFASLDDLAGSCSSMSQSSEICESVRLSNISAPPVLLRILADCHQARIAAGGGRVRGGRAFLDEVSKVVILAGGKPRPGQRLQPHDWPGAARKLAQGL